MSEQPSQPQRPERQQVQWCTTCRRLTDHHSARHPSTKEWPPLTMETKTPRPEGRE